MAETLSLEALVYLERIRSSTPAELSAWRHEFERAAARGMPWTAREAVNPPGGGVRRSPLGAWDEDHLT